MKANKDKKIETNPVTEIESLCMKCHDKGKTLLLTTKIPFFKDIIVMNFSCPHCGYRNTGIEDEKELSHMEFTLF